ncbi:MAG: hypothetical protein M3Z17_10310 [Gemmatimonadota bacterium]|nr:hypothetical protein [Gemmatimonadota bacterium]
MTATPIHNSRKDLESLTSLFLGAKSQYLTDSDLTRLIVRRERSEIASSARIPEVAATEWWLGGDSHGIADAVLALPTPIPFRDSGMASRLLALGLLRQWASSEAALAAALRRRLARAIALEASLAAGEYPTAAEMRTWVTGDDSVQLGLPGLLPLKTQDFGIDRLLLAVRAHYAALRELTDRLGQNRPLDETKCEKLRGLMRKLRGEPIIAFASYEATVTAFFRRLCATGHIAVMTSRGGRVAGGPISKREIECQFAPDSHPIREPERIDLLLTTDLLSEGVNLQRARAVVHLDIPWTAARMDQRIGRIARIGSRHPEVRVFGFLPPPSCEQILRGAAIVAAKWQTASTMIGTNYDHCLSSSPAPAAVRPVNEIHESLRTVMRRWRSGVQGDVNDCTVVAAIESSQSGFLALVEQNGIPFLVAGGSDHIFDSLAEIGGIASDAGGADIPVDQHAVESALQRLRAWLLVRQAKAVAGIVDGSSLRRRRNLLEKINSFAARVPPHKRAEKETTLVRARRFASSTHGAGRERLLINAGNDFAEFERLAETDRRFRRPERDLYDYRVRGLLLMTPTPAPSS